MGPMHDWKYEDCGEGGWLLLSTTTMATATMMTIVRLRRFASQCAAYKVAKSNRFDEASEKRTEASLSPVQNGTRVAIPSAFAPLCKL